ncbi:hypothetical protein E8E13_005514 [Curvularia kusanoi]|uniref:Major royal jelly protein n=1 Tax=Curvularia kusanoi TaxID=90978 RepID=A0A9P4T8X6_CURKU|nr:hypothetical protein E8E13_005514 [Curvularia kusanoi]
MLPQAFLIASALLTALSTAQVIADPGAAGGPLELVHLYYDQWPTGITVSRSGRKFSNYPAGLDSNNTNTGTITRYAVAELSSNNTETPYPNASINNPPGGAINYTTTPPTSANYQNYLIGVQSVVLDPLDRLWILDTGRVINPASGSLLLASPGGTKLVCVDITTNNVVQTIVFPPTVAFPDSYINDIRFDLRAELTSTGKGVAYITDSSSEGRNGIIIVDLGSGESWRHLDGITEVRAERGFVPFVWGQPLYYIPGPDLPLTTVPLGSDGIALSSDGCELYFGPVGGRGLYSVPTARLLDRSQSSELLAQGAVKNHGQRGVSDGFETDTNGFIYQGNMEQNQLNFYNPANGTISTVVRDPRISWIDTLSVASDGYLYFTDNQLVFSKSFYPGTDRRVRPFALWKVKLPGNGTRVDLQ